MKETIGLIHQVSILCLEQWSYIGWQNLNLLSQPNVTLFWRYSDILSMIIGLEWELEVSKLMDWSLMEFSNIIFSTLSSLDHISPPALGKVWDLKIFLLIFCSWSKSQKARAEEGNVKIVFLNQHLPFLLVPPNIRSNLLKSGLPSKWSPLVINTSLRSWRNINQSEARNIPLHGVLTNQKLVFTSSLLITTHWETPSLIWKIDP